MRHQRQLHNLKTYTPHIIQLRVVFITSAIDEPDEVQLKKPAVSAVRTPDETAGGVRGGGGEGLGMQHES